MRQEQDSQGAAETKSQAEVTPHMSLRLEDSKLLGICARQPVIKHTSRKLESSPLRIELAWSLASAALKADIGGLQVREKDSVRPPVGTVQLPHYAKHRSDVEIVDLVDVLCTLLINNCA